MPRVIADEWDEMIKGMPKEERRMKKNSLFISHLHLKVIKTDYPGSIPENSIS